ncbi:MAG TPA: NAD(P)-dependent oxidoreductase [Candidatus Limnocylindrales bacterium]|nr:NAD(P)-dependent oxidoreductase [Candidatus Limnocylindrales bacterium]
MRVAVTGAGGRLGRALIAALEEAPFTGPFGPIAWDRAVFDLDSPDRIDALIDRHRPEVVVHAAAWTDVDGCARDPETANRRNGAATGTVAGACAARGLDLVIISTNEVFDGRRTDGLGYGPADATGPINAYGASKLMGEEAAVAAFGIEATRRGATSGGALGIVRTAWLFGPPGNDFPAKILAAAGRARSTGEPLRVVADEVGSPTYTADLAAGIVELIGESAVAGIHHIVNAGAASRAEWARELLLQAAALRPDGGFDVPTLDVPASTWPRASTPPAWAVLAATPLPGGEPLRPWQAALADYLPTLLRQVATAGARP